MENSADNRIAPFDMKRSQGFLNYIIRIPFAFIIVALVVGLPAGIFFSIINVSLEGFGVGLIAGVICSLLGFAVIVPVDIFTKIKCYRKYGLVDFRVRQQRILHIDADYDTICETFQQEFRAWKGMQLRNKDMKRGIIEVETRRSWKTFGEKITVTLLKSGNRRVLVTISSKPRIFTTMLDYSKNFENLERIIQGIKDRLKEGGTRNVIREQ